MEEEDEEEEREVGAKRRGETPLYLLLPAPSAASFSARIAKRGGEKASEQQSAVQQKWDFIQVSDFFTQG